MVMIRHIALALLLALLPGMALADPYTIPPAPSTGGGGGAATVTSSSVTNALGFTPASTTALTNEAATARAAETAALAAANAALPASTAWVQSQNYLPLVSPAAVPTFAGLNLSLGANWLGPTGAVAGSIANAFPSAATPWQAMPIASVYMGTGVPLLPGDSGYGTQNYLGMPYGPMPGGFKIQNGIIYLSGHTYGWSGLGNPDDLLDVRANEGAPFRGTQGFGSYAGRLGYGQADSHAITVSNRVRGIGVTLTGLTAANFTTDSSIIDTATSAPLYRIVGAMTSAQAAALVPGDTVFTSNGYMAFIVKADPTGVTVDNWTRGAANITVNGNCLQHGPSVQPTAVSDTSCTQDIATAGALTAYVGTETTYEDIYQIVALLSTAVNPLTSFVRGSEIAMENDSFTLPVWNDAAPMGDLPNVGDHFGGVSAENPGSVIGTNGVGVAGFGTLYTGGIRRAFVADTRTVAPPSAPYTVQPYCAFCITQASTVQYGFLDESSGGGFVLAAKSGHSAATWSTLIDASGDGLFSGYVDGVTAVYVGSQSIAGTPYLRFFQTGSGTPDAYEYVASGTAGVAGSGTAVHVAASSWFYEATNTGGLKITPSISGGATLQTSAGVMSIRTAGSQTMYFGNGSNGNLISMAANAVMTFGSATPAQIATPTFNLIDSGNGTPDVVLLAHGGTGNQDGLFDIDASRLNVGSQSNVAGTTYLQFYNNGTTTPDAYDYVSLGTAGTKGAAVITRVASLSQFFDATGAGGLKITPSATGTVSLQTTGGLLSIQPGGTSTTYFGNGSHGNAMEILDAGATVVNPLLVKGGATTFGPQIFTSASVPLQLGLNGAPGNPTQFNGATADISYGTVTALTGGTDTIPNNSSSRLLNPAATIATFTEIMPANPIDGQIVTVLCGQTITTLTMTANGAQNFMPNASSFATTCGPVAGGSRSFRWFNVVAKWSIL